MADEVGPRPRDQLAGVVAIAGRMKRKETLAAEARSKPPFLIMTGADDRLLTADEIAQPAAKLSQVGIPVLRILTPGIGHGLSDEGITAASTFLRSCLLGTDPVAPDA